MDDTSLTGAITGLYDLLKDLRETIFATSQDRRSVADALYDTIDATKQREIAVRDSVSSQMDRFATKEARESAGNSALLKDEEYASLQEQVREQRHLLAYTDALLERKKSEHEAGLEMLRLLRLCAESSGITFNEEFDARVRSLIESAAAGDLPVENREAPAAGVDSSPSQNPDHKPNDPSDWAQTGEEPAPQSPGADSPVLEALRTYFRNHGTMTLTNLKKLAGANGFTEEAVKEILRDLFLRGVVDYYEATDTTEACWRLASAAS